MADEQPRPPSPLLRYFEYAHLPKRLQPTSKIFADAAGALEDLLPAGPEKTTALRKLLESKDCAVRAALDIKESAIPEFADIVIGETYSYVGMEPARDVVVLKTMQSESLVQIARAGDPHLRGDWVPVRKLRVKS